VASSRDAVTAADSIDGARIVAAGPAAGQDRFATAATALLAAIAWGLTLVLTLVEVN
jgi:hypothetical protein